ncbi:MAG: hypothetical protein ACT4PE_06440 [Candidatus Eiseniibacteriota bacterium]
MARAGVIVALLTLARTAGAAVDVVPRVGFDFEHFGETYRLSEDQDTVATIDDYGTLVGLTVKTPWDASRFRLDADVHVGRESRRARLDFEGRLQRGANAFEVVHRGVLRAFDEGGDYSIAGDALEEFVEVGWERRIGSRVRVRLRETVDLARHDEPDEYNLNMTLHRPGTDVRFAFGDLNELRLGYRPGWRSVPDSAALDYRRHTVDAAASLLLGGSASLDVTSQVDRRLYDASSTRESSWEGRNDFRFEFGSGERMTFRVVHENEIVRFDEPDELDFDRDWTRTGFQVEAHRTPEQDFSIMPVYAFLSSPDAHDEQYTETGLEAGMDWRIGSGAWLSVTDEIGRRDYDVGTEGGDTADTAAFSDYLYNRLTVLVSAEIAGNVAVNLFANWQPEDHRANEHDTDTKIVSGGVEYRF